MRLGSTSFFTFCCCFFYLRLGDVIADKDISSVITHIPAIGRFRSLNASAIQPQPSHQLHPTCQPIPGLDSPLVQDITPNFNLGVDYNFDIAFVPFSATSNLAPKVSASVPLKINYWDLKISILFGLAVSFMNSS